MELAHVVPSIQILVMCLLLVKLCVCVFVLIIDDSASATSSMEVTDRIASLEQRVQMQEDEIQLLKSALADVVRRLNISEEQQAMLSRKGPTKGIGHTHIHGETVCTLLDQPKMFYLPDKSAEIV